MAACDGEPKPVAPGQRHTFRRHSMRLDDDDDDDEAAAVVVEGVDEMEKKKKKKKKKKKERQQWRLDTTVNVY